MEEPNFYNQEPELIISGKLSSLLAVNITGAVLGSVIMYVWMQIRTLRGWGPFFIVYFVFLLYLFADIMYWIYNGIQEIRLYDTFFEISRGKKHKIIRVQYSEITDINVRSRMTRVSLQILLGQKTVRIPGIYTYYPGKKIWITNDAYNDNEFNSMMELLKQKFELYGTK